MVTDAIAARPLLERQKQYHRKVRCIKGTERRNGIQVAPGCDWPDLTVSGWDSNVEGPRLGPLKTVTHYLIND